MRVQLDYDRKTISVENSINLSQFMTKIKKILPDWKDWELQTNTIINSNPYYIYNDKPWWVNPGPIYCTSQTITEGTTDIKNVSSGTYVLELN